MTTKKKKTDQKRLPACRRKNISDQLHDAWKLQIRTGDAQLISEKSGFSKVLKNVGYSPFTIQNALTYGYANSDGLVDFITKFYSERYVNELNAAESLTSALSKQNTE